MKELTISISDELYGKLLLVPQSEEYIVSVVEKALSGADITDSETLFDMKATLDSIDSRLAKLESGSGIPNQNTPQNKASGQSEKSSPQYLPDTSNFYRKLAVINGIAVDGKSGEGGGQGNGVPDTLERNILMYVAPGIELKKSILLSLLSIRFPEDDIEQKIRQMVRAGKLCESKSGENACVSRD